MISLKEFLEKNDATAFEYIENRVILNVVVGEAIYGIDVDTSDIENGITTKKTVDFTITESVLKVDNLELNILTTYML